MISKELLVNLVARQKPSEELVQKLITKIDFKVDEGYLDYIISTNGGEGKVNKNYLLLYEIDDLVVVNPYYEDHEFCDKIFVIGSNGGDVAYAIKKEKSEFICVPFLDMNEDACQSLGKSFNDFLTHLQID